MVKILKLSIDKKGPLHSFHMAFGKQPKSFTMWLSFLNFLGLIFSKIAIMADNTQQTFINFM